MSEYSHTVLVDAKYQYTKQLKLFLKPEILMCFISIYKNAFTICKERREEELILLTFQQLLEEVPKWNQNMIEEITQDIVKKCDWIEELLMAIFISHTKILTSVRVCSKNKKINLKIPCIENFLHKTFINVARELWKTPDLLYEHVLTKLEYQKNIRITESIIEECIENTIFHLLPVKSILREYLGDHKENDDDLAQDSFYTEYDEVPPSISNPTPLPSQSHPSSVSIPALPLETNITTSVNTITESNAFPPVIAPQLEPSLVVPLTIDPIIEPVVPSTIDPIIEPVVPPLSSPTMAVEIPFTPVIQETPTVINTPHDTSHHPNSFECFVDTISNEKKNVDLNDFMKEEVTIQPETAIVDTEKEKEKTTSNLLDSLQFEEINLSLT